MPKNKPPKKRRKRRSRFKDHTFSGLHQHKQQGTKFTPPLAALPNMKQSSWADQHMPEMLWAVLLAEVLPREAYLGCFREIVGTCAPWLARQPSDHAAGEEPPTLVEGGINWTVVLDHTRLSEIPQEQFDRFVAIPLRHPLGYAALRPLALLDSLPGFERWRKALGAEPDDDDWHTLGLAIAAVLDHQSEKATDARWLKVVTGVVAGKMHFPEQMRDYLRELLRYPDAGDMHRVRPSIRADELQLRRHPASAWIEEFWAELFRKTTCVDPSHAREYTRHSSNIDKESLYHARASVIRRFFEHLGSDRVNARQDSAFGLALYALAIVEEIGAHAVQQGILGRAALRALVEAAVTLRYLAQKDYSELWTSYRVYGAGQAKLAFLKAQEGDDDLPSFIDEGTLFSIANEDKWQEFLEIDVGHWSRSNLRALAIECGAKDIYDKYYGWASTFVHAHWGAIRDTNFITCHNPLHRLHRVPRWLHRSVNSVDADVVALTNDMLAVLDTLFPGDDRMSKLSLTASRRDEPSKNGAAEAV